MGFAIASNVGNRLESGTAAFIARVHESCRYHRLP
jgi:hypothetical protein